MTVWSRIKLLEITVTALSGSTTELVGNIAKTIGNNCMSNTDFCKTLNITICSQCERGGHLLKTLCPTGINSLDQQRNRIFEGQ